MHYNEFSQNKILVHHVDVCHIMFVSFRITPFLLSQQYYVVETILLLDVIHRLPHARQYQMRQNLASIKSFVMETISSSIACPGTPHVNFPSSATKSYV